MKLLMVFNPHAAVGRAAQLLPALRSALQRFAAVEVLETRGAGDAVERVAAADLSAFDGLLAAGGDGTLFEVLNGLYQQPAGRRIPLGLVPVGTGNAFARDLGLLPGDWQKGIGIIRAGGQRRVDVGRVTHDAGSYHFLNIVGAGLPADAMHTAEHLKFVGRASYSLAALWRAVLLRSYPLVIEIDGDRIEQEAVFVEVSNTRYTGTSFLMAPSARFDDGVLDVTLLRRLPRRRLLRLFPSIYSGRHVAYAEVLTRQARHVRLLAPQGLQLAPDGEFRGSLPATIECLPGDLAIFA